MNIIFPYTIYVDREDCPKGENTGKFQAGNRYTQMSYQKSWKNSRLEKRNIRENSCL
jgi:hypothetical protein